MNINLIASTIDTSSPPNHENIPIANIDQIPPSACTNLIMNNVLNNLTQQQLELLTSKIRHGGTITMHSPDAMEMAKALYWETINVEKFASLIANTVTQHSMIEIKTFFEQRGYSIDTANTDTNLLFFNIKAKRQ